MKKVNIKHIALSLLAVVLVMIITVGVTYSWIDDVKLVQFENDNLSDGAPLKSGVDINAGVNITSANNTINLGNILTNSDTTFQYQENATSPTRNHIRYDTESANAATNPQWDKVDNADGINEKKGYFYESGGMHLSPCYSDGDTFYFPVGNNVYREGNKDDENVNYISFTTKVSSPDANVDFWFKTVPSITGKNASGQTVDVSDYARYAIIVDGQSHVYSSTGTARTGTSTLSGNIPVGGVRQTAAYTYGNEANTGSRGTNGNTLFSIKKGATVKMTVKIWLESGVSNTVTTSDINLELMSSWAGTRRIWIDDKTTNGSGGSWLDDNSATLYVVFPEALKAQQASPGDWPNVTDGPFYNRDDRTTEANNKLKYDSTSGKYYFDVPLVYNNEKMMLYRCNSTYWNNSTSNTAQRSEYSVYCWNWWQTIAPDTFQDETYTLYGGSLDSTANGYFNSIGEGFTVTNKGYGTWGEVEEIHVYSHYGGTDYATKGSGRALYIVDYSDEDTSGEKYIYEMNRANNNTNTPWKVYVPKSSAKIKFRYFGSGDNTVAWGYSSWGNENPQRRPLQSSGLYASNSTVYHFARHFGGDKGWGYWEGAENVYLIKTGFLASESNLYAYMFDSGDVYLKVNSEWSPNSPRFAAYFWNGSNNYEVTMTKVDDDTYMAPKPSGTWTNILFKRYNPSDGSLWNKTVDLEYKDGQKFTINGKTGDNYTGSWSVVHKGAFPGDSLTAMTYVTGTNSGNNVYKQYAGSQSQVFKSGSARVYNSIIFSKGNNSNQSKTLTLFPGCFYEPGAAKTDNGKWYGALDENGRDASSSSGNSGGGGGGGNNDHGTDQTGGNMDGYNTDAGFVFTIDGQNYTAKTNGSDFRVRITLNSTGSHTTYVKKGSTNYKNGANYTSYLIRSGLDLYLSTQDSSHNNDFGITNTSTGNFIVYFQYDNGNENTIKIFTILKEA